MENKKNIKERIKHYGEELYDEIFEQAPINHLVDICVIFGFVCALLGNSLKNTEVQTIVNSIAIILGISGLVLAFLKSTQKQGNNENSNRKFKHEKL